MPVWKKLVFWLAQKWMFYKIIDFVSLPNDISLDMGIVNKCIRRNPRYEKISRRLSNIKSWMIPRFYVLLTK